MSVLAQLLGMMAQAQNAPVVQVGYVGQMSPSFSGLGPVTATYALPAGAAVGDVAISMLGSYGAAITVDSQPDATTSLIGDAAVGSGFMRLFATVLTATQVSAGSIDFTYSGSGGVMTCGFVYTNVDGASVLDVAFSQAVASGTVPFDLVAPGVTTLNDGDRLIYVGYTNTSSVGAPQWAPPAGYAVRQNITTSNARLFTDIVQSNHGATGDVSASYDDPTTGTPTMDWGAWLLALRCSGSPSPGITLSANFPASMSVGDAVSFDITAALENGATGTLTITDDTLPAGLSLGATSQVDATHYKATVSGTLTTAQTITSTFDATGGSVAATPLVHEFDVQVASSNVTQVDTQVFFRSANSGTPLSVTLANVKANDLIVAVISYITTQPTWVFNVNDGASNTYAPLISIIGGAGATDIYSFSANAAADAANLVVSASITGHSISGLLTVYQLRGGTVVAANCVSHGYTTLQPAGTALSTPAFALSSGGIALTPASIYISGANPTFSPITPSAGTYTSDDDDIYSASVHLYSGHVSGAGAQSGMSITWTPNPTTSQWRGTCLGIPVNPA